MKTDDHFRARRKNTKTATISIAGLVATALFAAQPIWGQNLPGSRHEAASDNFLAELIEPFVRHTNSLDAWNSFPEFEVWGGPPTTNFPPLIYEWFPFVPVTIAVGEPLDLFGDVDDFGGGGVYLCVWTSDRGLIQTQVVLRLDPGWINFKSRLTYIPTAADMGERTLTLTVYDPAGLTDEQSFAVTVTGPQLHISSALLNHDTILVFAAWLGWSYRLLTSSNLVNWESVGTFNGTGTPLAVTHTNAIGDQQRFWRLEAKAGSFSP